MNLILHIIRKDFRHVRLYLGVWYALLLTQYSLLGTGRDFPDPSLGGLAPISAALFLNALVQTVFMAVIISKVVHDDSVVGSTAFWMSRPISRSKLLVSKTLMLALSVVLPATLIQLVESPSTIDLAYTSQDYIPVPILPNGIMMVAVLTHSLPRMALLAGVMVSVWSVGFVGLIIGFSTSANFQGNLDVLYEFFQLLHIFFLGGTGAVICHQYLTRRTNRSLIVAFSGIVLSLFLLGSLLLARTFLSGPS